MVLTVIALYLIAVLIVGFLGYRMFKGTGEDYFLASRTIGSFVLLMTLFGTNMTAFTILGASGEAYAHGIGVFALMASSSSLLAPLVFYFVGTRLWWLGKRHGYLTQVQFFRDRYESDATGFAMFFSVVVLLIPYVLIGVKGSGEALMALTGGPENGVPVWLGSLLVCAVIFVYVMYGGMRSTAWANTFQTLVFMVVGVVSFFVILRGYGGIEAAMQTLQEENSSLLIIGKTRYQFLKIVSYLFVPLSVGVFPHIFSHWLAARSARTFRAPIVLYPICITLVWVPSVVLGVIGNIDFPPPINGPILVHLILQHAGGLLAGLLAAGIFAAIMSSLDSQTLSVGTLFTEDVISHYRFHDRLEEEKKVFYGRCFVAVFLAVVFALSCWTSRSIFNMGVWSLSGFAGLFPVVVAALYWKRSTKQGVLAAIGVVALLWATFFKFSSGIAGDYTIGGSGLMPVAVLFAACSATVWVVSCLTKPPGSATLDKFFP